MKEASKVIMGATLVMVATLAIVLALILVLLAELYCSLLLRRRRSRSQLKRPTNDTTTAPTITESTTTSPLSSFYAQGVLHAPTDFLFPAATLSNMAEKENRLTFLHRVIELHGRESKTRPHRIGILSPTSPSTSFAASSPNNAEEISVQACSGSFGSGVDDLVYISNPIYDNDAAPDTPFETPDASPSRLENSSSSGEEEDKGCFGIYSPPPFTPPLSPMKKLPAQAVSVPLRDVGSLATSASDSNCNNGVSSSSSSSPCTSPSW